MAGIALTGSASGIGAMTRARLAADGGTDASVRPDTF
jgi:hypothetical protein